MLSRIQKKTIKVQLLFDFYLLLASLGIIIYCCTIAGRVIKSFLLKQYIFSSFEVWASGAVGKSTALYLAAYFFTVAALFFYYLVVRFVFFKRAISFFFKKRKNLRELLQYYIVLFFISLYPLFFYRGTCLGFLLFLTITFYPFFDIRKFSLEFPKNAGKAIPLMLLSVLFLQVCYIFYPYIAKEAYISNDYLNIPEVTHIGESYYDNLAYINEYHIGGLSLYDPRLELSKQDFLTNTGLGGVVGLPVTSDTLIFSLLYPDQFSLTTLDNKSLVLARLNCYDSKFLLLLTKIKNSEASKKFLQKCVEYKINYGGVERIYTDEQQNFIKLNEQELYYQALAGHYFHHKMVVLNAINQYSLGGEIGKVNFYYGVGNSIFLTKVIHLLGGVNFQNFLKISYTFYFLYYLMFIFVVYLIFKDFWTVALAVTICFSCLNFLGFEFIRFAPGFNPLRHFLDLFVLLGLFFYGKDSKEKNVFLLIAFLLGLLAVFCSEEMGLAIFLSSVATVFIVNFQKKQADRVTIFLTIFSCFICFFLLKMAKAPDYLFQYTLLGVSTPIPHKLDLILLLSFISFIYFGLSKYKRKLASSPYYILIWFSFFYCQATTLYVLWNFEPNHIFANAGPWSIFFVLLIHEAFRLSPYMLGIKKKVFPIITLLIFVFAYIPSIIIYFKDLSKYNNIFKTHVVYHWDFPTARFNSTMDPALFKSAVDLIQKYSYDTNKIYIISKYDNFLPFLSHKYSAMPFTEIMTSMVTETEEKLAANSILKRMPEYIYVDTDINRCKIGDTFFRDDPAALEVDFNNRASVEGRGRVTVLNTLLVLFNAISPYYRPIEKTGLITVYKRK